MIMYIVLGVVAVLCLWAIAQYNGVVRLKALLNEAFSGIDVQCKRRSDLIPNLVAIVKQYSIHEKEVLENVTRMRSVALGSTDIDQRAKAEAGITGALKTLFAVSESYPDLKANQNFLQLQRDLVVIEEELNLARRYYNGTARNYNTKICVFPTNIIVSTFNFGAVPYFELTSETERQAPKITF